MKDEELYNLIKKAVRQKKNLPHHTQTLSFAERYCETQLKRKFYNNRSHQKMGMLMKNFNQLQTYFDLPQLVKEIRQLKNKEIQEHKIKSIKRIENNSQPQPEVKNEENKGFANFKNLRSSIQTHYTKGLLDSIQNNNIWKSQVLNNNSPYHMSSVEEGLRNYKQKQGSTQNKKLFQNLQMFLKNEKEFILNQKNHNPQQNKAIGDQKKEVTQFLHKVSSYLQIILEKQHKSKWKRQRKSSIFKPKNFNISKYTKSHYFHQRNAIQPTLITDDLSHAKCIQTLKQQASLLKRQPEKPQKSKYLIKRPKQRLYTQMPSNKQTFQTRSSGFKQMANNQTASIGNETTEMMRKQNSQIKQNFTFRRRSIKEKIIKKLDKFIDEIDDQTQSSKKENTYYNLQINKLEHNLKKLFSRYRKETLVDQQEIQNLKRLAQEFSVSTPKKRTSPFESDRSYPTEKVLESRDLCQKMVYGNNNFSECLF